MSKYLYLIFCAVMVTAIPVCTEGQIITTFAGNGIYGSSGDGGPATAAQFEYMWYVATDSAGNAYITDNFDHRIRKVNTAGVITTFAGNGTAGFSGDGGLAVSAEFIGAAGIAIDRAGNVYFSDINNRRVRKVNTSGIISTIAGTGVAGFSGDGGAATAAKLDAPYGVAVDNAGNVYVADELNYRIREIDMATGLITTVAGTGTGGYSGDGGAATDAEISPTGIAVDGAGNIYMTTNSRIRKVNAAGIITTVAGTGTAGFSGDGAAATAAELNQPIGVSVDGIGNVFISDQYNNRIRKVRTTGIIKTIAGNGTLGYTGDSIAATSAELYEPHGVSTDFYGNVYICDWGNYRVRRIISGNHLPSFINWPSDSIAVCENSTADTINALLAVTDIDTGQAETWTVISPAMHGTAAVAYSTISTGDTLTPSGATYTPMTGYSGFDTFKVRVDDGQSLDTLTILVRVKPLPDTGVVTGNTNACVGVPDTLSDTAAGGIWSVTNSHALVSATGVVVGLTAGVDTVIHSFTLEGCSLGASLAVTVYPVTDSISGAPAVCTGLSIPLTGIPGGGIWSVTNTLVSVSGGIAYGDTAGVDTVIYTIANVCGVFSTIKPITVIGFTIPVVVITSNPTSILAGGYDTLTATITGGGGISYGYQWQVNTHYIPGATDSVFISDSLSEYDSVTCFVTNGPCNFSTFSWIYITYDHTGIGQLNADAGMILFPNPSDGSLTVKASMPATDKEARIDITDVTGRVVYEEAVPVTGGRLYEHINAGNLANGMYMLQMTTDSGQRVIREFVISR